MSNSEQHHADGISENRERKPPVYFTVLFYGLIVWGVIFMAYYLLSGWSSETEFQQKMTAHQAQTATPPAVKTTPSPAALNPAPTATAAPVADTRGLYAEHCAPCHGAEAKGAYGPDLTKSKKRDPAVLRQEIAAGIGNKMPAFASKLSAAEIDALVSYLQQL